MNTEDFPIDPYKRKVILVLTQYELEKSRYEPGAANALLNSEFHVLSFPVLINERTPDVLRDLVTSKIVRPGTILIQNPYDDDNYVEASSAVKKFALEKYFHFCNLCRHLGARQVDILEADNTVRYNETEIGLKIKSNGGSGGLSSESESLESLKAEMELRCTFDGGEPDLDAAQKLLRKKGLLADTGMQSLIDMRTGGSNQLKTRRLILNLANESKSSLKILGHMQVPAYIKVDCDIKSIASEKHDYKLTVEVLF
jgi:hypothetical protein